MRAIRQLPPAGPSAAPPPPAGALESGPTRHLAHAIAVLRGHDAARPLEAHEAAALAVLYRAYAAMLLTVARRLMRCDAEAEDVVTTSSAACRRSSRSTATAVSAGGSSR
jgi:Ser/Thr protein kinase RdoA (MazF antagonist)